MGDSPGDGDARFAGRVRRVVVVCAVAAVAVLPGCTLHGQVVEKRDPQPTGSQVDPMKRPVSRAGSNMPGAPSGASTTTTTTGEFD